MTVISCSFTTWIITTIAKAKSWLARLWSRKSVSAVANTWETVSSKDGALSRASERSGESVSEIRSKLRRIFSKNSVLRLAFADSASHSCLTSSSNALLHIGLPIWRIILYRALRPLVSALWTARKIWSGKQRRLSAIAIRSSLLIVEADIFNLLNTSLMTVAGSATRLTVRQSFSIVSKTWATTSLKVGAPSGGGVSLISSSGSM